MEARRREAPGWLEKSSFASLLVRYEEIPSQVEQPEG